MGRATDDRDRKVIRIEGIALCDPQRVAGVDGDRTATQHADRVSGVNPLY